MSPDDFRLEMQELRRRYSIPEDAPVTPSRLSKVKIIQTNTRLCLPVPARIIHGPGRAKTG